MPFYPVHLTQEQNAISINEVKEGLMIVPPHGETIKDGDVMGAMIGGVAVGSSSCGGETSWEYSLAQRKVKEHFMFRCCVYLTMVRHCLMQRCILVIGSAANLFAVTRRLAPRMMRDKRSFNVTRANYRPAIRQANKGCIYTQKHS